MKRSSLFGGRAFAKWKQDDQFPMPTFLKAGLVFLVCISAFSDEPTDRIWEGGSALVAQASCALTILSWNIERGEQLQELLSTLQQLSPAVALIQECDMNARRTGNRNIAEKLSRQLGLNYLFAAEFVELGQSVGGMPAYHGQAILTALPSSSTRVIRFRTQTNEWQPRWYLPNWGIFQRRSGGRIALVTELGRDPQRMVVYNVHLESRGGEEIRLRQIEDVIADMQRYSTDTPILLAGDLNTRQPESPAVVALFKAGFRKAVGEEITTKRGAALDWIFVRGPLSFTNGAIHWNVRASDHFPLTVQVRHERPECRQ
jgi:endonuclease/exonuclease/phosphatase family metal-dependent hydrolase